MARTSTTRSRFTATPFARSRRYLNAESRLAGSPEDQDAQIIPTLFSGGAGPRCRRYRLRSDLFHSRDASTQRESHVHVVDRRANKRSGREGPATEAGTGLDAARQNLTKPSTRGARR